MNEWDVVVVGGGLAGMSAAVASAEQGARVAVLEKGQDLYYPCNSRMAMGFLTIGGLDSRAAPERILATVNAATANEADPALAAALAQNAGSAFSWLRRQGVKFIQFGSAGARKPVLVPLVQLRAGANPRGRGADAMLRRLEARLSELGGVILRGNRARELIMRDGKCCGVVAQTNQGAVTYGAHAVVLSDGGYQADPELLERFLGVKADAILQRNSGSGGGDGVRMAEHVGAKIVGAPAFYGHVQSLDALHDRNLWPYPVLDIPITAGIAVDRCGQRFLDEGMGGIAVANGIASTADPLGTYAIFDHQIMDGPARQLVVAPNPHLLKAGGTVFTADTLEGLASLAGINPEALAATVSSYNVALEARQAHLLPVPRTGTVVAPIPIKKPPFYAAPVCAGITYTMNGIAIDDQSRVLHRDGGIIPNLYAAGSTTGGHEGGSQCGYTGGLVKAAVFGLRAAASIAKNMQAHS